MISASNSVNIMLCALRVSRSKGSIIQGNLCCVSILLKMFCNDSQLHPHNLCIHRNLCIQFGTGMIVGWSVQLGPSSCSVQLYSVQKYVRSSHHQGENVFICLSGLRPPTQFELRLTKTFRIFLIIRICPYCIESQPSYCPLFRNGPDPYYIFRLP